MFKLRRSIKSRSRLAVAILFGLCVSGLLPHSQPLLTRIIISWDSGVWLYLLSMVWLANQAQHGHVKQTAWQEHPARLTELCIISLAAFASLAAIVVELSAVNQLPQSQRLFHYVVTFITVFSSWFLITVFFTLHYAHLFYTAPTNDLPLLFADKTPHPDYWDFLYFAFTISVAAQTSDVMVVSKAMRKTVLAQSILSFIFNVSIVGLTINVVAGILAD